MCILRQVQCPLKIKTSGALRVTPAFQTRVSDLIIYPFKFKYNLATSYHKQYFFQRATCLLGTFNLTKSIYYYRLSILAAGRESR